MEQKDRRSEATFALEGWVSEDAASSVIEAARCPNCGAWAPAKFCPECGQETRVAPRTVRQFLEEALRRWLSTDGLLWQTLRRLFFAPGELTAEYLAGRRARYLRPLQLYLAVSVIAFAAVQAFGVTAELRFFGERGIHLLRASPPTAEQTAGASPIRIVLDYASTDGVRRFNAMSSKERFSFLHAKRARYVSSFVLFLVPFFALILSALYRDRHQRFGGHLVFGLHVHSFVLSTVLLEAMLPTVLANVASLGVIAYVITALRRVYGGSWAQAVTRGASALLLYVAVAFVANLLLILALVEL